MSAQPRARVAITLLMIAAIIKALLILTLIAQLAFPAFTKGQEAADNAGGLAALLFYAVLTMLSFIVLVITAVFFLMWLHRVCSNLPAFGYWKAEDTPFTLPPFGATRQIKSFLTEIFWCTGSRNSF